MSFLCVRKTNQFLSTGKPLHILVNNAGIMWVPLRRDRRGFESQLSTNHLGDFQKTFHTLPQKWLTKKRLELAHYQITEHIKKPVDVYLEVGFEDLSHFSFAFKKLFGYLPTALVKKA